MISQMQGVGSKLEESYIVPVARELAVALEAIHAAGIIHRDVKAANVMIHENGSLQLIDFGVSGLLQTGKDKRSTIIGTPHWMPPEMSSQLLNQGPSTIGYGNEVSEHIEMRRMIKDTTDTYRLMCGHMGVRYTKLLPETPRTIELNPGAN